MANEAARLPSVVASTVYDVGRTLALWVSAFEIVAHPGGAGRSNMSTVADLIERVEWREATLGAAAHNVRIGGRTSQHPLATRVLYGVS
jgi:hypothetical protein